MTPRPHFVARHEGDTTYWDCRTCSTPAVAQHARRNPKDSRALRAKCAHQCQPPKGKAA